MCATTIGISKFFTQSCLGGGLIGNVTIIFEICIGEAILLIVKKYSYVCRDFIDIMKMYV